MKKDKKATKTESRFKSKLANSAIEKARAFFRSFELKQHNRNDQPSSTIHQHTTATVLSSSSDFILMDEDYKKKDSFLNSIPSTTNISITRNPRVEKINPKDLIVHRVMHNDENDIKISSNYFQEKYKQYLKPSLLLPKQYYNDILNRPNQNYFSSFNRHDLNPHSLTSTVSPNFIYSPLKYSTANNEISSHHQMSTSLYNYRPLVCHEIESSSYNEQYSRVTSPIIRPLPSSSSMSTWNQSVRRLNTEYRLTINALQQAKECLEQVYSNSKYNNFVSHIPKDLLNNETKKTANVTFRLPSPPISNQFSSSSSISTNRIEHNKIFPSVKFSKPKLVKPVELDIFSPTSPELKPVLSIIENDEKLDSIADIIKKFNDLSNSFNQEQSVIDYPITTNSRVHFKPSVATYELKEIPDQSPAPLLLSESILINKEHQLDNFPLEEETTYTVETFYQSTDDKKNDLVSNDPHIVIIRENTTEEQFNLAHEKQHQEIQIKEIPPINNTSSSTTISPILVNNKSSSSSIPIKNNNKSISQIPRRITTNVSRLKQPSKIISSSTIANNPTIPIRKPSDSTSSHHVKSMVHQLNTTISSRSSTTNKRFSRPISTGKTTVHRK